MPVPIQCKSTHSVAVLNLIEGNNCRGRLMALSATSYSPLQSGYGFGYYFAEVWPALLRAGLG